MIPQITKALRACLSIAFSFIYIFSTAQDSTSNNLSVLNGHSQPIYYSPGFVDRATAMANFIDSAEVFFQNTLSFKPRARLFILEEKDWSKEAATPMKGTYGFPHMIEGEKLVIAATDNGFWKSMLPPAAGLPAPVVARMNQAYRQSDSSYSRQAFFDLLAIHELGHAYTIQAKLTMQRHWMSELFVNIMLHTYIAEEKKELLPALELFPEMTIANGTSGYQYTSLEDFERVYTNFEISPQNYGWYQCCQTYLRKRREAGVAEIMGNSFFAKRKVIR